MLVIICYLIYFHLAALDFDRRRMRLFLQHSFAKDWSTTRWMLKSTLRYWFGSFGLYIIALWKRWHHSTKMNKPQLMLYRQFELCYWLQFLKDLIYIDVVSKPQIRLKGPAKRDYIPDLNKLRYASSVRPIEKAQHTWVCEHLSEAVLHLIVIKSDANPAQAGQRSHWALDGVLKPPLSQSLTGFTIDIDRSRFILQHSVKLVNSDYTTLKILTDVLFFS